jgi:virulence factor
MSPSQVRVGLVGAGSIAQVAELPALAANPDAIIAGIVTATDESRHANLERWPIEAGYDSLDEMIAEANLDALFVLTPKGDHVRFIETAFEAGLDVFCEKPLASSLDDSRRLAELADEEKRLLMVGFNRRYAEVYARAREAFEPGRPSFCVAQKNRMGSEYRATLENAIHMIDLLRWFCGEAVDVTAHAVAPDPYEEDGTMALIRFDSGAVGALVGARCAGEWDERLDAYGNSTSVSVVAPDRVTMTDRGTTQVVEMRPRAMGWAQVNVTMGFGPEVDHFVECVRTRAAPRTDGREAVRTHELVEEILRSAGLPLEEKP